MKEFFRCLRSNGGRRGSRIKSFWLQMHGSSHHSGPPSRALRGGTLPHSRSIYLFHPRPCEYIYIWISDTDLEIDITVYAFHWHQDEKTQKNYLKMIQF